jgi:hypothetical protein
MVSPRAHHSSNRNQAKCLQHPSAPPRSQPQTNPDSDGEAESGTDSFSSFSGIEECEPPPSTSISRQANIPSSSHGSSGDPSESTSLNATIQRWSASKLESTNDSSTRRLISSLATLTRPSTQGFSSESKPEVALAVQESNRGMRKSSIRPSQAKGKGKENPRLPSNMRKGKGREVESVRVHQPIQRWPVDTHYHLLQ